jgi:streptogramin lyase
LFAAFPMALPAQNAPAVSFGAANVCAAGQTTPSPCSATLPVALQVTASGTVSTVGVLTGGASGLDFTLADGGSCSGTLAAGAPCTVSVKFAPALPGPRAGAVVLADGNGNTLASTYLSGTGVAPQIGFSPSSIDVLDFSPYNPVFFHPSSLALDGAGNVFVTLPSNTSAVKEIVAADGYATVKTLGSGLSQPRGIAVDGGGNVFVTDTLNHAVKELLAADGYATIVTIANGFDIPSGLAVDGSGNLFVSDSGVNAVYELPAAGGYAPLIPLGGGFNFPQGLAVDGSGNVYVADSANNAVKQILAAGGYTAVNTLGSGFRFPYGVAVDAAANVYVADYNHSLVKQIVAAGGYQTINTLTGTTFNAPQGVAVDGAGDVFVANTFSNDIVELLRSQPMPSPAMFFQSTEVGKTSSDSPQSVVIQNTGNAVLTVASSLSEGIDFTEVPTPSSCNAVAAGLAPGLGCTVGIAFAPQSVGPLSDTLNLADNSLNVNGASQALGLLGSGIVIPPHAQISASAFNFGDLTFGSVQSFNLKVTNTGGQTLTVNGLVNGPSFTVLPGSNCGAGVAGGASCLLQIQFNPPTVGVHKNVLTLFTNGGSNPTVALRGAAVGVGLTQQTSVKFGAVALGSTATLPLTVSNYGVPGSPTVKIAINGPSYKALPYSGCYTAGVAPGASCTFLVQFTPVSAGSHNDILTATSTISGTVSKATLIGTGVAP